MIIRKIMKIMLAGIISIVILCIIFSFYYMIPVHKNSELGNTDYVWPKNSVWIKTVEGISYGKFDSQGFNNLKVIHNPDILILGSSHMEAAFVMQDENLGYILQEKTREDNKTVYNMGISGHHFEKVLQYLPKTLSLYKKNPEFIIIGDQFNFFKF